MSKNLGIAVTDDPRSDGSPVSVAAGTTTSTFTGTPTDYNLDQLYLLGYRTYDSKPIIGLDGVVQHIDSGTSISVPTNGVITYGFFTGNHAVGINNNPHLGEGKGYSPFSPAQEAAAVHAMSLWDDLIPETFVNVGDVSVSERAHGDATILLQNTTTGPAQAWTYYPGGVHQYERISSDVWTATPSNNWTNTWFGNMGYGDTTLIHELGHSLGLSHPGAYNYDPNVTQDYAGLAEYAQDSTQYSIMSYWPATETGAQIVNWNTLLYGYAQTPLLMTFSRSRKNMGPIRLLGPRIRRTASTQMPGTTCSTSRRTATPTSRFTMRAGTIRLTCPVSMFRSSSIFTLGRSARSAPALQTPTSQMPSSRN